MKTPRTAVWIWYRGGGFNGYQRQPGGLTVQDALLQALQACGVAGTPVPAGRTDRGVHARMQVVSLRPRGAADPAELSHRLRPHLPPGLGIAAVAPAARAFHAQWSATAKEYRYRLALGRSPEEPWAPYCWAPAQEPTPLTPAPEQIDRVLRHAVGTRDFIAFHEKSSVRKLRTVRRAELRPLAGGLFEAVLQGDGFGRYQVRYLVGGAVAVASGALAEDDYLAALETGKEIRGLKAPARGLILWEVSYDPAVDPFGAELRSRPPGLPEEPPFYS